MAGRGALASASPRRRGAGEPLAGWVPAPRGRRAVAWGIDLFLQVFGTDTQRPADRARMVRRSLLHRTAARVIGVCTLGVGYAYILGAAAGTTRRILYDDWSQTVVLGRTA